MAASPIRRDAVLGFRTSLWIIAAGLALHGVFDFTRHLLVAGRGVPEWWPGFCAAYDVAAAVGLGTILLLERRRSASPEQDRIKDTSA